jgi:hypothetical protein
VRSRLESVENTVCALLFGWSVSRTVMKYSHGMDYKKSSLRKFHYTTGPDPRTQPRAVRTRRGGGAVRSVTVESACEMRHPLFRADTSCSDGE